MNLVTTLSLTLIFALESFERPSRVIQRFAETFIPQPPRSIIYVLEYSVRLTNRLGLGTSPSELRVELGCRTTDFDRARLRARGPAATGSLSLPGFPTKPSPPLGVSGSCNAPPRAYFHREIAENIMRVPCDSNNVAKLAC